MNAAEPQAVITRAANPSAFSHQHSARPLKIALLGYRSHPHVGGQGIYLQYLSRALMTLGHQVDVYSGPPYPNLDAGVNLIQVPSLNLFESESHIRALRPKHLRSWSNTVEWASMATGGFSEPYTFGRRVAKLLKNQQYDVIHDNQSLCYGLLSLQKAGHTVVSTIHHPIHRDRSIALDAAEKWGDRLLIKRWYSFLTMQEKVAKQLKHVVTVSEASQRDISHYFKRSASETHVIPNGIDTGTFRPMAKVPKIEGRILTTASSDQPLKGLSVLLHALSQAKDTSPHASLRVIGKLKEDGAAAAALKELKLDDRVSFVSGLTTDELVKEYAQASLFVCPSKYEGFGLPAGEAMACGVPVVSSDGGALPEVVGNAGMLTPAGDASALSAAISQVLNDETLRKRLSHEGRARIEATFSWQQVAQQLTDYYRRLSHANH